MVACRYFDGISSRPSPAMAEADGTSLRIVAEDIDRIVERKSLSFVPAGLGGPARIAFADRGLCEIDDADAAEALFAQLGHRRSPADRLASRTWRVLAVTGAFIAVMAALYAWGIPWIADRLIDRAPRSWDEALGIKLLNTLDGQGLFKPSALSPAVQQRIRQRFQALAIPDRPDGLRTGLIFRKVGVPNALALPGGVIVLTDEIVDLAQGDDDAIATVLAHEVGHEVHRDSLRQLARSTIASALAAWYFGDVSNLAVVTAGSVGTLSYSRAAEHRADLFAVATMRANGIPTHGAAELFRRLEGWEPPHDATAKGDGSREAATSPGKRSRFHVPEYLSTHPDTDERIRLFDRDTTGGDGADAVR